MGASLLPGVAELIQLRAPGPAKEALLAAAVGGQSIVFVGPPDTPTVELAQCLSGLLAGGASVVRLADDYDRRAVEDAEVVLMEDLPSVPLRELQILADRLTGASFRRPGSPFSPLIAAAMLPCACGYFGDRRRECVCTPKHLERFVSRCSPALLHAIDFHCWLSPPDPDLGWGVDDSDLLAPRLAAVRARFLRARSEGNLTVGTGIPTWMRVEPGARRLLAHAVKVGHSTLQDAVTALRGAASLAVLRGRDDIAPSHVTDTLQWRWTWWE